MFASAAPLLANLAPLVEMFKVEGTGTLEIVFGEQQESQEAIGEWSSVVDTGSGTLVAADGRWPVYAITHGGLVRGSLTRVVSRGTECGGDEYNAVFTFDRPLPKSTYAIIHSTFPLNPAKATITTARELAYFARPGYQSGLWYVDLEGDGRPDIAVTIGGESWKGDDYFTSSIFANVNGSWKMLVASSRPSSCT
jgi:hypothetical protein